ncbi:enoyl reductase-like protein [Colletotrichum plurivorum]|uniref:Enoyl reductase-like protein n=1 Tax=Colletotrichum plurivorum TaxID=2175906 RepID=A0A8H6K6F9_9PEZI|nr:enoyl reductase-like protein [Colletotrichum plurivorum]
MQNAVLVTEVGKPLELAQRPMPHPGEGEILIRVHSTMLLPHDTYGRDLGLFVADKLPYVLGTNIAGVVEEIGPKVEDYKVGDRVFGIGNPLSPLPDFSGLQQYALLTPEGYAKIPDGVSFEEASVFPVNAVTSAAALFHPKDLAFAAPFTKTVPDTAPDLPPNADRSLVIVGGGSNVGKLAIQFARLASVSKIIVIASAKNEARLRQLGATHVIDRHLEEEAIAAEVRKITHDEKGPLSVYDCFSWDYSLTVSLVPRTYPSVIACLHPAESCIELVKLNDLPARVQFIRGTVEFLQPLSADLWRILPTWIVSGQLAVSQFRVVDGLDLKAIEGLDSYRDGSSVVPLIIRPNH